MRMELKGRPTLNALNTESFRWRAKFSMIAWHDPPRPGGSNENREEVLRNLTPAQKAVNSTKGSTPGLRDPLLGEQGGRVPLPTPPRPVRRPEATTIAKCSQETKNVTKQNNSIALQSTTSGKGNLDFGSSGGPGSSKPPVHRGGQSQHLDRAIGGNLPVSSVNENLLSIKPRTDG